MQVVNITETTPFLWKPPADRPAGVHLSDILKLMREEYLNQVYPDDEDLEPEELEYSKAKREEGFMWESMCTIGYADGIMPRAEPFQFEGVWMSPDGMGVINEAGVVRIDEIKWTQSYKTPNEVPYWMWQVMGYCWAIKTQHCRFYVCHHNGVSRSDRGPTPQLYQLTFGWNELQENWAAIINFARAKEMIV